MKSDWLKNSAKKRTTPLVVCLTSDRHKALAMATMACLEPSLEEYEWPKKIGRLQACREWPERFVFEF